MAFVGSGSADLQALAGFLRTPSGAQHPAPQHSASVDQLGHRATRAQSPRTGARTTHPLEHKVLKHTVLPHSHKPESR